MTNWEWRVFKESANFDKAILSRIHKSSSKRWSKRIKSRADNYYELTYLTKAIHKTVFYPHGVKSRGAPVSLLAFGSADMEALLAKITPRCKDAASPRLEVKVLQQVKARGAEQYDKYGCDSFHKIIELTSGMGDDFNIYEGGDFKDFLTGKINKTSASVASLVEVRIEKKIDKTYDATNELWIEHTVMDVTVRELANNKKGVISGLAQVPTDRRRFYSISIEGCSPPTIYSKVESLFGLEDTVWSRKCVDAFATRYPDVLIGGYPRLARTLALQTSQINLMPLDESMFGLDTIPE